jgi:intracellular septation protein
MKLLLDFLPLILFFAVFKYAEGHGDAAARFATEHLGFAVHGGTVNAEQAPVLLATVVVVLATVLQIVVLKILRKPVDRMLWISAVIVTVLGAMTVWFNNPLFIQWKPSVLYWIMAGVLAVAKLGWNKNLVQSVVGRQVGLPASFWSPLLWAWVGFFAFVGVLNIWVAYNFSTSSWATFKVFGITGLLLAFMVVQGVVLSKHFQDVEERDPTT